MRKTTALAIAIASISMLFAFDAGALPLAPVTSQPVVGNTVTLVRDGCGRGYYYSRRWERCVEERDYDHGYRGPRYTEESCEHHCRVRHAECNWHRGGYFNGCGVAYNTCLAACK
jgi:hypothetical protein